MKSKSSWVLLLLLLSGIVLGGFIGEMTARVPGLSWLNFGESFGLNDPLVLNLGILVITFGLSIRITMASIIGVIVAILIYRFLEEDLFSGKLLSAGECTDDKKGISAAPCTWRDRKGGMSVWKRNVERR